MRWRLGWRVRPRLTAAAGLAAVRAPCSTRRPCGPLWGAARRTWAGASPCLTAAARLAAAYAPHSAGRSARCGTQARRTWAGACPCLAAAAGRLQGFYPQARRAW